MNLIHGPSHKLSISCASQAFRAKYLSKWYKIEHEIFLVYFFPPNYFLSALPTKLISPLEKSKLHYYKASFMYFSLNYFVIFNSTKKLVDL